MTFEEYCQAVIDAYEIMDEEKFKPILEATMDEVVKPAFAENMPPEECCDSVLEYYYNSDLCEDEDEEE